MCAAFVRTNMSKTGTTMPLMAKVCREGRKIKKTRNQHRTLFTAYWSSWYNKTQPSARTSVPIYEYDFRSISSRKYFIIIYFANEFALNGRVLLLMDGCDCALWCRQAGRNIEIMPKTSLVYFIVPINWAQATIYCTTVAMQQHLRVQPHRVLM